jgi:lambda repressor-like predicted transcriptional regulator
MSACETTTERPALADWMPIQTPDGLWCVWSERTQLPVKLGTKQAILLPDVSRALGSIDRAHDAFRAAHADPDRWVRLLASLPPATARYLASKVGEPVERPALVPLRQLPASSVSNPYVVGDQPPAMSEPVKAAPALPAMSYGRAYKAPGAKCKRTRANTPRYDDKIRALHAEGLYTAAIAQRIPCKESTVRKAYKRMGLTANKKVTVAQLREREAQKAEREAQRKMELAQRRERDRQRAAAAREERREAQLREAAEQAERARVARKEGQRLAREREQAHAQAQADLARMEQDREARERQAAAAAWDQQAVTLRKQGQTLRAIATQLGCSVSRIEGALRRQGYVPGDEVATRPVIRDEAGKAVRAEDDPRRDEIARLYAAPLGLAEIAKKTGYNPKRVRAVLVAAGVQIRPKGAPLGSAKYKERA